jgi:uracil-DNA glycosylase family 4
MARRSLDTLASVTREIEGCRACPRLVEWREAVARDKRAAYADEEYWGRGVAGFGDPDARVLIVGLAPAAHGANRTGRVFTGDRSGDFLFASLHRCGYANQARCVDRNDGLELHDAYVSAAVRCAPPANKPTPVERDTCRPYLVREIALLARTRVIVVLGAFAYDALWAALRASDTVAPAVPARRARFGHLMEQTAGPYTVLGSFHPSQQNTFTGRLTPDMLDAVWVRARQLSDLERDRSVRR